jgi:para-nitrobenzyl esterase
MPEAKGLFNRAIIQSPGPLPFSTPEESAVRTATFLKLVGVSPSNIDDLYKLSTQKLNAAASTITAAANGARYEFKAMHSTADKNMWKPVVDGRTVLFEPTQTNAPSNVPVMIGTALHEMFTAVGHPEENDMNEQQAREVLHEHIGSAGDQAYDIYKSAFQHASPFDISAMARATEHMRMYCVKMAQKRATFNAAPSYLYWFQWQAKILGGRAKSHHELECPLAFLHSDDAPTWTGGTADARALGVRLADTWLQFARAGDPNNKGLPRWTPVTPDKVTSMVFDSQCRIDQGSDAAAIELIWKSRHPLS